MQYAVKFEVSLINGCIQKMVVIWIALLNFFLLLKEDNFFIV